MTRRFLHHTRLRTEKMTWNISSSSDYSVRIYIHIYMEPANTLVFNRGCQVTT